MWWSSLFMLHTVCLILLNVLYCQSILCHFVHCMATFHIISYHKKRSGIHWPFGILLGIWILFFFWSILYLFFGKKLLKYSVVERWTKKKENNSFKHSSSWMVWWLKKNIPVWRWRLPFIIPFFENKLLESIVKWQNFMNFFFFGFRIDHFLG